MSVAEFPTKVMRPSIGDTVAIRHRSTCKPNGKAELEKLGGKPEIAMVTAVYAQLGRVRVTSGEFWDVIPCKNSTAKWETSDDCHKN